METEAHLISSIHRGERQALRRFYDRYAGRAMAVALRYMGDGEEAKDVVQNAFVKMLTAVGSFELRGEGSLGSWAMRIVVNESLSALRSQHRMLHIDQIGTDLPGDDDEPAVEKVPPDVLTALIGQLPAGYRTVLNLHVFEQMSHQQIAAMLGIKADTSASQFSRAKRLLQTKINNYLRTGRL